MYCTDILNRTVQLDFATAWTCLCRSQYRDRKDAESRDFVEASLVNYGKAFQVSQQLLGKGHRWTLMCLYRYAWVYAHACGDHQLP